MTYRLPKSRKSNFATEPLPALSFPRCDNISAYSADEHFFCIQQVPMVSDALNLPVAHREAREHMVVVPGLGPLGAGATGDPLHRYVIPFFESAAHLDGGIVHALVKNGVAALRHPRRLPHARHPPSDIGSESRFRYCKVTARKRSKEREHDLRIIFDIHRTLPSSMARCCVEESAALLY